MHVCVCLCVSSISYNDSDHPFMELYALLGLNL